MNQVRIYRDFPLTATSGDFLIYVVFITTGLLVLAFWYYYFATAALLFGGFYALKFLYGRLKAFRLHMLSKHLDSYRVAILGSGLAGIDAAIQCKKSGIPFVVFEKNSQVGGTWWANTYPGCECDIASHMYSYSFEPNSQWSKKFSDQKEILDYIVKVVSKYNIREDIRLNHKVETARWDDNSKLWTVEYVDAKGEWCTEQFKFVVAAIGPLARPYIPPELKADLKHFKGSHFHTAEWNHDIDLRGLKVAVIGSAASAIQAVVEVAKVTRSLTVFQRTPNWLLPKENYEYSRLQKFFFQYIPFSMTIYRSFLYVRNEGIYFTVAGPYRAKGLKEIFGSYLHDTFTDKTLAKNLTPNYEVGCKRILLSQDLDYYKCFENKSTSLVVEKIAKVTENCIITESNEVFEVDVIIFATGFDFSGQQAVKIYGKNNLLMNDITPRDLRAYLGVSLGEFPNLFLLMGPNTGLFWNSVIFMIECQVNYVVEAVLFLAKEKKQAMEARKTRIDGYYEADILPYLSNPVWSGCNSWFKDATGHIFVLWPRFTFIYWWKCLINQYYYSSDYIVSQ